MEKLAPQNWSFFPRFVMFTSSFVYIIVWNHSVDFGSTRSLFWVYWSKVSAKGLGNFGHGREMVQTVHKMMGRPKWKNRAESRSNYQPTKR